MPDNDDSELPIDAWTLEAVLDGSSLGAPDDTGVAELSALVDAARRPGSAEELAGQDAALAAFAVAAAGFSVPLPSTRRSSVLSALTGSKLALAAAVGAVTLGGASAAAFTGSLPGPAQGAAHRLLGAPQTDEADEADETEPTQSPTETPTGAPSGTPTSSPRSTPVGPAADGAAAFGLCTAWTAQQAAGVTPDAHAVAFRNLVLAAGGADKVAAYCATVPAHGKPTAHPTGSPTSHPTSKPTSHPTGSPTSHPTGKPTSHPTKPASHPTGSPTSHPTGH